jgi:hypothetical protein
MRAGFPDIVFAIKEQISEGDKGLFLRDQGLELGVGGQNVLGDGAKNVDFEAVVPGVLEGGSDEFHGEAAAAQLFGDLGVEEGQPALVIGFEFKVAGLAVMDELEAAAGDF